MGPRRSKKRSDKPSSSEPRSDVTFFVDRSLGKRAVAEALRSLAFLVVAHDDVFDAATEDRQWLAHAGENNWIVLSADKGIRRKPDNLDAFVRHKVRAVVITSGNLSAADQTRIFVTYGRRIQDVLMSSKPPVAYAITKVGVLSRLSLHRRVSGLAP